MLLASCYGWDSVTNIKIFLSTVPAGPPPPYELANETMERPVEVFDRLVGTGVVKRGTGHLIWAPDLGTWFGHLIWAPTFLTLLVQLELFVQIIPVLEISNAKFTKNGAILDKFLDEFLVYIIKFIYWFKIWYYWLDSDLGPLAMKLLVQSTMLQW